MPTTDPNEAFLTAALTVIRLSHEGGYATVDLPNAATGQMESLHFDQSEARAFVAGLMDAVAAYALADPTTPPNALQILGLWLTPPPPTKH